MRLGKNLLAIEVTQYAPKNRRVPLENSQAPMSATLYMAMADGSVELFASGGKGWKSALNATGEWFSPQYNDTSWREAEVFVPPASNFTLTKLGKPWETGPVGILRRSFQVAK